MPLDTRTKTDENGEKQVKRAYSFSTVVASLFLLAMTIVAFLVVTTSYFGARNVVQHSISQLSDHIKLIAEMTFHEYIQVTGEIDKLLTGSNTLIKAVHEENRAQQQKILSEVYYAHQGGQLDLLFLQVGHDRDNLVNASTVVFDIEELINQALSVPRSNYENFLIIDETTEEKLYAIINKSVMLAEETGRVLGYVYTGLILNDNIEILNEIQKNTNAESIYLLYNGQDISSLYTLENRQEENENGGIINKNSRNLMITTDVDVMTPSMKALSLKIAHPQSAIRMLEREYFNMIYKVAFSIVMIIIVFFLILKGLTHYATLSLTRYASAIAKDKKTAYFRPAGIREFNEVGMTLSHLIQEMSAAEEKILQSNRELEKLARIASAAKDDLKKTNTDLENANRELEEFAYRTSHDLRSPLVSSIALLDVAEQAVHDKDTDMVLNTVGMIRDSLTRLEMLIRDILILNEIKHREEPYEKLQVKNIIEDSLTKLSAMENFKKIKIETDYQCPVFYSKKMKSQMIIENLISNAIKYYDPAKKQPYIKISSFAEDEYFVLQVKDNGLGIPREKRSRLFTMFSRLHPKVSFGSGLGLYLIKKGAQAMGGDIRYKNHRDGSIFEFILPLQSNKNKKDHNENEKPVDKE